MNASKVLNEKSLDSAFSSHFMKDPVVNFEEEVENTVERINSKVLTLSDEFKEDLILDKKLQTEVDNYKKSIEKLEKQWIKELNINALEEKLNKAKKELQKRLKKEEIKFNLTEKKSKLKSVNERLSFFNLMKNQHIESELKKIPKKHREEILKKIK